MSQALPRRVTIPGEKIAQLVFDKIFPAMQGEPVDAMVLSLICAAALAMRPDLNQAQLQDIILETSGHLITQLADPTSAEESN